MRRKPADGVKFPLAGLVTCAACGRYAHGVTGSHGNTALACPRCARGRAYARIEALSWTSG